MKTIDYCEVKWTSSVYGAKAKKISEIDDQYLSNILWFNEVFNGWNRYNSKVSFFMELELTKRGIERFPWKPLPIDNELKELKRMGMIHVSGSIIREVYQNKFETIGNLTHIDNWKNI